MTGIQDTGGDGLTQHIHVSNARIKNSIVRWTKTKRQVFGNEITGKNIKLSSECSNDGIPVSAVIKNNAGTCVSITYALKVEHLRAILAAQNEAKPGRSAISKKTSRLNAIPA